MVRDLIGALFEAAGTHGLDIVLVTNNAPAFQAAQNARRLYLLDQADTGDLAPPPVLTRDLVEMAKRLAHHAASGSLVLFIGAGVSKGAGLPSW